MQLLTYISASTGASQLFTNNYCNGKVVTYDHLLIVEASPMPQETRGSTNAAPDFVSIYSDCSATKSVSILNSSKWRIKSGDPKIRCNRHTTFSVITYACVCLFVCMYVCVHAHTYVRPHVRTYAYIYACMCVCMYACRLYVGMHACMRACTQSTLVNLTHLLVHAFIHS